MPPVRLYPSIPITKSVGGVDGFNLIPVDQPGSVKDFVDLVVPELQKRGRYRESYPETPVSLRELYLDGCNPRLTESHPAHRVALG